MIELINLRLLGIAILFALVGSAIAGSQTSSAFAGNILTTDIDADEFERAGNTTNMTMGKTNQTESQNMTGSMMDHSTS